MTVPVSSANALCRVEWMDFQLKHTGGQNLQWQKKNMSDALRIKTFWDCYISTYRSQLTTCTKASAKMHLKCRCAISSQSFLFSSTWLSASVVCNDIPKRCWGKLKKVSSLFSVILLVSPKSFSSVDSLLLCPTVWTALVKVLVRKDAEGFLYLMLRVTGKEVEPEQTSGEQSDTGDLDNPHYTWTKFFIGICIRSCARQISLVLLQKSVN